MEYKVMCYSSIMKANEAINNNIEKGFEPISIGTGLAGNVRQVNARGERDWDEVFERSICILLKKE